MLFTIPCILWAKVKQGEVITIYLTSAGRVRNFVFQSQNRDCIKWTIGMPYGLTKVVEI